jgi:ferric iron reductase protein FhuF
VIQVERQGLASVALPDLAETSVLHPMLERFAELYPGIKRPPVASQWSMNYLSVMLPAMLAVVLTRERGIAFWEHEVALLHDAGQPRALWLPTLPLSLAAEQHDDYWARLLHEHLEPLFASIAAWGGLAPKVLWGNFAAIWDGAFARIDAKLEREGFTEAHRWLERAVVADGRIKPRSLQWMVDSPAPEICARIPLRRHCCLHYQLHAPVPDQPQVLCESCPKLHRLPEAEQAGYLRLIYQQ